MKLNRIINPFLSTLIIALLLITGACFAAQGQDGKLVKNKAIGNRDGINITAITYMSCGLKVRGLLFMEKGARKLPCVIFCHDGICGISKEHRLSSLRLARAGYAVFCPSYRGEDGSQGKIEIAKGEVSDVLNAIKLVSGIKGIDGNNIALAGASHGALICVLAAGRSKGKIKAVVSAYGVMDIYRWWDYLKENNKIGKDEITRRTYGDGPQDQPDSFAIRNAVSFAKNISCPALILQGQKDDIVPPDQAVCLKSALDRHKIPNIMKIYPNCLHGFLVYAPYLEKDVTKEEKAETEDAWKTMIDFLDYNMKK